MQFNRRRHTAGLAVRRHWVISGTWDIYPLNLNYRVFTGDLSQKSHGGLDDFSELPSKYRWLGGNWPRE
jgi:hypothetical protein